MRKDIAPLSGSFLLVGLFLLFLGLLVIIPISLNYGLLVTIFGGIMVIASLISTTYGPVEAELALDEHVSERKQRVKKLSKKEYDARR